MSVSSAGTLESVIEKLMKDGGSATFVTRDFGTRIVSPTRSGRDKVGEDGWIMWRATNEDVEPLPGDTIVEIQLRDGSTDVDRVDMYSWNDCADVTIARYRVVQESKEDPGWIPWDSEARREAPRSGICHVKLKNGKIQPALSAGAWRWSESGGNSDIMAYKFKTVKEKDSRSDIIRWRATPNSRYPLPKMTEVRVLLRDNEENENFSNSCEMGSLRWSRTGKDPGGGDIVAYQLVGEVTEGWQPFSPTRDNKLPCGMGEVVEVRTRDGSVGQNHAHKFNWKRILKYRDREIVAWRKVLRSGG